MRYHRAMDPSLFGVIVKEPPPTPYPLTFYGMPVQVDPSMPVGVFELVYRRTTQSPVDAMLDSIASDMSSADYEYDQEMRSLTD